MKVVVSGASGFVASEIIPLLVESGHDVLLVSRAPSVLQPSFPSLTILSVDNWYHSARHFDMVLNLVGPTLDPDVICESNEEAYLRATQEIAVRAREVGIRRFIHLSSIHCVELADKSPYTAAKRQAEKIVRQSFGDGCEIYRVGAVYGHKVYGRRRFLNFLPRGLKPVAQGLLSALTPTTHVQSIVAAVERDAGADSEPRILVADAEASVVYRLWRSSLNLLFLAVVLALLPLWAFVWVLIVVRDGFPGLFLQDRVGKSGRIFRCVKFRTLVRGTAATGTHLLGEESFTVTGRVLRKMKIDEIPQAINILRGDMHLIGPRPALPGQREVHVSRAFLGISDATPGLTGWAQVNGADMSEPHRLAQLDYDYLGIRSILWDIRIISRTIRKNR
jgi:lipopolysaccharide/colanic/teichoic acid biosynthesis glycosyltransferase